MATKRVKVKKSELKAWAREHLRGIQNCLMPSFTPQSLELDEEGIRWDVRQTIEHGFVATLCTAEAGLTFQEAKRFVEIVADEAKDRIFVSTTVMFDTFEHNFEMLRHAEKVGCDCALLDYPHNFFPQSEEEIYRITKEMCDSTNLGIFLHPVPKDSFKKFHPGGFPPQLLERMADIENVVGVELGEVGLMAEYFGRCKGKILLQCPFERWLPLMVHQCGQQLLGPGAYELYQSPEKPYLVEYFNLLMKGDFAKAMEIYWKLTPAREAFEVKMMQIMSTGAHPWPMWKYYQWLVGGNGGFAFTRQPVMEIRQQDMELAKMALRMIGITPREPDEEFYFGRVNYAKLGKSQR